MSSSLKVECEIRGIRSWEIDSHWKSAKPLIQKALDRGSNYSIDEVYMGLRRAEMQLWMYEDKAALVTALHEKRGKKYCLLLALGGTDMRIWFQHLPTLELWAGEQGCSEMRLYGRIGWAKATGYDIEWTKMSKQLETGNVQRAENSYIDYEQ